MVSAIDSIRASIPNVQNKQNDPAGMDKTDFLTLLVSQLQHQDPLNPQDPTEFTSQLTQFSSLEQMINMNEGLSGLGESQFLSSQIAAAGYVGKDAVIAGDSIRLQNAAANTMQYQLGGDATTTTVNIYNSAGALVRTEQIGAKAAGKYDYTWDGKTTTGNSVPDGNYRFEVVAKDGSGKVVSSSTAFTGRIDGVTYENGSIGLKIHGSTYDISSLISVDQPAAA